MSVNEIHSIIKERELVGNRLIYQNYFRILNAS